ncbi:3-ketoacyl-ACP reductase [Shivajiella indica]|uniref:3-ketoacyl-ACP reductase n=1 Tax=Shivajiella indica TaxID=872115 RepID=A0ABW5B785_9BACT
MKQVALITGGTRGIGLGIARQLALNGFDLALNGIREEKDVIPVMEELRALGKEVIYAQGNIALLEDHQRIIEKVNTHFGKLNILVNNAGVAPRVRADVLEVSPEDFDEVMDINLRGTFFLTQSVAQWMLKQKQEQPFESYTIINITSVSAILGSTNRAVYCMSKASLSMMSKVFAMRMAEEGIPVYEVRPGVVETDMIAKVKEIYQERIQTGLTLEKRMGQPEDIGKAVAVLAKGDISYATGQVITIDGGMTVERL